MENIIFEGFRPLRNFLTFPVHIFAYRDPKRKFFMLIFCKISGDLFTKNGKTAIFKGLRPLRNILKFFFSIHFPWDIKRKVFLFIFGQISGGLFTLNGKIAIFKGFRGLRPLRNFLRLLFSLHFLSDRKRKLFLFIFCQISGDLFT